jgi:hypothetical protein
MQAEFLKFQAEGGAHDTVPEVVQDAQLASVLNFALDDGGESGLSVWAGCGCVTHSLCACLPNHTSAEEKMGEERRKRVKGGGVLCGASVV